MSTHDTETLRFIARTSSQYDSLARGLASEVLSERARATEARRLLAESDDDCATIRASLAAAETQVRVLEAERVRAEDEARRMGESLRESVATCTELRRSLANRDDGYSKSQKAISECAVHNANVARADWSKALADRDALRTQWRDMSALLFVDLDDGKPAVDASPDACIAQVADELRDAKKARAERDEARARLATAARTIIEAMGSVGPENAEDAAVRIVEALDAYRAAAAVDLPRLRSQSDALVQADALAAIAWDVTQMLPHSVAAQVNGAVVRYRNARKAAQS